MVNCDNCKKQFKIDVKIKKYDKGVEKVHFYCPHCKQEYISYFTNKRIRKMISRGERQEVILSEMQKLAAIMLRDYNG